jgi:anion-transporting  ArsA/GET3 family ATPase
MSSSEPAVTAEDRPAGDLGAALDERSVIVCVGTGGVGKTTTAAALALAAARRGRRTVVLTIDPARRLADTLGGGPLDNTPRPVDGSDGRDPSSPGELWATMLDPKATFDDLVRRHAADAAQAERILANRLYGSISTSLGGVQEYMAMEKLHELHGDRRFDLVVVDTPPSANVLALLGSPRLLGRLFDSWLYRSLVPSTRAARVASGVLQGVVRPLTRLVGAPVIDEAVGFFRSFEGMEDGFRKRADRTLAVLRGPETAFVLVTAPGSDALAEAETLTRDLGRAGAAPVGMVVNLVTPTFAAPGTDTADLLARAAGTPWEPHARALHEGALRHRFEQDAIAAAAGRCGIASVTTVADLGEAVTVATVADALADG